MVIIRKLNTSNLSTEAYEQYGQHDAVAVPAWASRNGKRYGKKEQGK